MGLLDRWRKVKSNPQPLVQGPTTEELKNLELQIAALELRTDAIIRSKNAQVNRHNPNDTAK
jgi:hypothetical protein